MLKGFFLIQRIMEQKQLMHNILTCHIRVSWQLLSKFLYPQEAKSPLACNTGLVKHILELKIKDVCCCRLWKFAHLFCLFSGNSTVSLSEDINLHHLQSNSLNFLHRALSSNKSSRLNEKMHHFSGWFELISLLFKGLWTFFTVKVTPFT